MSSPLRRLLVSLAGLVLLTTAAIPAAHAKKKVVVLPFTGFGGPAARNGVMQIVKRQAGLINPEKYRATADALGVAPTDPAGIVAVCAKLRCDAVVTGEVSGQGRRLRLTVTVYNGGTGAVLGRRVAAARGLRKVGRAGAALGRKAAPLVAKGQAGAAGAAAPSTPPPSAQPPPEEAVTPPAPEPAEEPIKSAEEGAEDTSDIPVFRSSKRQRHDDAHEEGNGEAAAEEKARTTTSRQRKNRDSIFDLAVGIGGATRSCTVTGSDTNIQPNKYKPGLYPEFMLRGEIYPLTPVVRNVLNGLGVGLGYSRHILIATSFEEDRGRTVSSTSQEFALSLLWRWYILSRPTSPMVKLAAGWGLRDFTLAQNNVLTSFNYRFIQIGLDGAIPLGTPYVALTVGFDYRPVMTVGQEAVNAFGGKKGAYGWAVRGGLGGDLALSTGRIFYFATVELMRFTTQFAGLDASGSDKRDGYPDRSDSSKAQDQFIRFWGGLGYGY